MKPAVVVVDMLNDAFTTHGIGMTPEVRLVIDKTNQLTKFARSHSMPVIFAMDSFLRGDFIFRGKMKEHSIRGTNGANVTDKLIQTETDIYLPKRRFSAFFKTDLDQTLRLYNVDIVAISGINTHWCVLTTAMDALAHDFRAYIIEDCCTSYRGEIHTTIVDMYRKNPLHPLFQIMPLDDFINEFQ
ncbi:MAG TPA: cysteine hydrolase [Deltaproteobacteria bacterium]|nr:cysteine hydrolase [Deltaproteobacteria bacterium]